MRDQLAGRGAGWGGDVAAAERRWPRCRRRRGPLLRACGGRRCSFLSRVRQRRGPRQGSRTKGDALPRSPSAPKSQQCANGAESWSGGFQDGAGGDGSGDRLVTEGGGAAGHTWGADLALWGRCWRLGRNTQKGEPHFGGTLSLLASISLGPF